MVLLEVDHNVLGEFIERNYNAKLPLFIWGTTGIGKSESTEKKGREIAEKNGRKFIVWNKISKEEKHEIEKEPSKYFVFMDIRLSQMDPSDLRGLPALNGVDTVEWRIPYWLHISTLPDIMGFLFFDEINLAPPSIQASAYQLILDRALGEVTISDGMSVLAAGNRIEDRANVYDLPKPLQNRFNHITLKIPHYEDWTEWALQNGVDERIIAFILAHPAKLMGKISSHNQDMAFPTPRSWGKYCNRLIKGETSLPMIEKLASSAVGLGAAMEFTSFVKYQTKIDWAGILKEPKKVKEIKDMEMKYSLLGLASGWYEKNYTKPHLDKILHIADNMDPEFAVLLLRFCKAKHDKAFKSQAPTLKIWDKIWDKYGKYFSV